NPQENKGGETTPTIFLAWKPLRKGMNPGKSQTKYGYGDIRAKSISGYFQLESRTENATRPRPDKNGLKHHLKKSLGFRRHTHTRLDSNQDCLRKSMTTSMSYEWGYPQPISWPTLKRSFRTRKRTMGPSHPSGHLY